MVHPKTPEKDFLKGLRQARSRAGMLVGIKFGVWLLLLALCFQGCAKILSNHLGISTTKFFEKDGILPAVLGFGSTCLIYIVIFGTFFGIKRCFRPFNPLLFDRICVGLDWFSGRIADLIVSLKTKTKFAFLYANNIFVFFRSCVSLQP